MDFKYVYTSTKTYIILLIVAFALLLFAASMSYKQIIQMQKSAEMVTHTLQVYNAIGNFSQHYNQADSEEFRKELLKKPSISILLENYRLEGKTVVDSLSTLTIDNPLQQAKLKPIRSLLNKLYDQLYVLDTLNLKSDQAFFETKELQKTKISTTLYNIRVFNYQMLKEEERLMHKRKAEYASHKSLAPVTSLLLAFSALFISYISFLRIYKNKQRIKESEAFLKSILSTTNNVINYYEPIFDTRDNITDFKIVYANDCNRDYFNLEPDKIKGKTVSEVFPFLIEKGELKELIKCYTQNINVDFDREITVKNKKMWFSSFITPLVNGVLVTSRNTTAEEKAKKEQLLFKEQLEKQNLELLDNRAFLGNIFKSISHVVIHFKSIRDKAGKIIDFNILFINEKINPILGDAPEEIINKKASEVYPNIFKSGAFENLVDAIENNKPIYYETSYQENNNEQWFKATAIKLGDGVTVTTRNITEEKKNSDQLIKLNEELIIQNSILSDAESLAKIGSYIWYIDTDVSELSDNFYHMLGCQPNEFKSSLIKYREFIHPDERELYDKRSKEILTDLKTREHTYRIITKQGKVKHFKTNGQFINKNGKTVMIGVVQDVTDSIEAEQKLLKSNLKLKQSNAELESFNRVASHDLQEPLRKIQLFISRIEDRDIEQLSAKSKTYFEKVIKAVKRMQSLIQNLLTYSRIDSSKTDFEKVNLNNVLNKVKDDLANRIIETKAEMVTDKLPEIKGVVFQMEQLFTNLIYNALKYKSLSDVPKLRICYKKIDASDLPKQNMKSKQYYHKISFIDNGIGFDSQYAEKIFEVFQRLHQKTEYSGTGIGLAICKKIVENHGGLITAKGNVGLGAEFIIYLPA